MDVHIIQLNPNPMESRCQSPIRPWIHTCVSLCTVPRGMWRVVDDIPAPRPWYGPRAKFLAYYYSAHDRCFEFYFFCSNTFKLGCVVVAAQPIPDLALWLGPWSTTFSSQQLKKENGTCRNILLVECGLVPLSYIESYIHFQWQYSSLLIIRDKVKAKFMAK